MRHLWSGHENCDVVRLLSGHVHGDVYSSDIVDERVAGGIALASPDTATNVIISNCHA